MKDRLVGCRTKIERAKKHIVDLQAAIDAARETQLYRFATQRDPKTGHLVYYVTNVQEPPPSISAIAGDVLQNLRSALDHLAYQLVCVGMGSNGPFRWPQFPVYDSAEKYESGKNAVIHGMRPEAIKAIDQTKPYKGGNDTLWRLHELNRIDKHRVLITVAGQYHSLDLGGLLSREMQRLFPQSPFPEMSVFFGVKGRLVPLKVGDPLLVDQRPDAKPDEKMKFAIQVVLYESGVIEGEPLIETLQQMIDLVDSLIPTFAPLLV